MSRHACPTCHTPHDVPKVRSVLLSYARALAFAGIEVLAALALDGWLSVGLWGIAVWNVFLVVMSTVGLANMAANVLTSDSTTAATTEETDRG